MMRACRRVFFVIGLLAFAVPLVAADSAVQNQLHEAVAIAQAQGVRYNQIWTPPGEVASLRMDCSNTAQWLTRRCEGIYLPRTASEQYEVLQQQHRLHGAPRSTETLRQHLQPGDLLFWKNTYAPKRKPPITHVMVYLGSDIQGKMWMVGSQTSHGVGVYAFNPKAMMGGYRIFFGLFKVHGRFVGYGRPLLK
ncbi:MAG: NlpC/P60 family protein [Chthoniobacterales bacterium]